MKRCNELHRFSRKAVENMKISKRILVFMTSLILVVAFCLPVEAKGIDVTQKYKTKVTRILRGFDDYLGYACGDNQYFKFDDYAKTTMVYLRYYGKIASRSTVYAKKKMIPYMRLYFNTSKIKLRNFSGYGPFRNPSDIIQNNKGTLVYTSGELGEVHPRGSVKRIEKAGQNYYVTYIMRWYHIGGATEKGYYVKGYLSDSSYMGTYRITLRRSNNRNGFYIKNIRQTDSAYVYI